MTHKRGHKTRGRKTRRGGDLRGSVEKVAASVKSAAKGVFGTKQAPEMTEKETRAANEKYDPYPAASTVVGNVNPAMKDYVKKQIAEGVPPFVAKLKEDKLMGKSTGNFVVPITQPVFDKLPRGGKRTRKLPKGAKGFMVRRVCAISLVPVGIKTRRRKH